MNDWVILTDIQQAINVIKSTYGDDVSVVDKAKNLFKFGKNPSVWTTSSTIWFTGKYQANETYCTTNAIDTISSETASDSEVVNIEWHTISGGNLTFVRQQATLNGQNKVTLTTPLARMTRMEHASLSDVDIIGEVYGYQNTAITAWRPVDTTKIHLTVPAWENKSQKASTSVSSTDYWIITSFYGGLEEKTWSNFADIRIQSRPIGWVFTQVSNGLALATWFWERDDYTPFVIIPKNSDVRIVAESSATGQLIVAWMRGYLARIV